MNSRVRKILTLPPADKRWMPSSYHLFLFIPKAEISEPEGYLFLLIPLIAICLAAACFTLLFALSCTGYLHIDNPILIPFLRLFSFYNGLMMVGVIIPLFVLLLAINVRLETYDPSWISTSPPKSITSLIYRIVFGYAVGAILSFGGWSFIAYLIGHASDQVKNSYVVLFVSGVPLIWISGVAALCFSFSTSLWVAPLLRKLQAPN